MIKPLKRIDFTGTFAQMKVGDIAEFSFAETSELALRRAAGRSNVTTKMALRVRKCSTEQKYKVTRIL